MRISAKLLKISSSAVAILGVLFAVFGAVRFGSLALAIGTAGIALGFIKSPRRIDFYLPFAIAIALFVLAIALPQGG